MKYITRGNTSPVGKPWIYFCCHENDFEKYFEDTKNDILKYQDCAVWYKEKDENFGIDFYSKLYEMQLFVIPVTSSFLLTDNQALNTEFQYAIVNKIPVLPIMLEGGLDSIFRDKCGNIQFLDKFKIDETAIPYEEKLEKYLSAVLIHDGISDRIDQAFDGHFFLSYRKIDREHAKRLMSEIHDHEKCRRIAIWYDEFLTIGEDFNDSISNAIKQSNIFLLAVTPNISIAGNYVIEHEYPMAVNEQKPILSVMLVDTDKNDFNGKFDPVPFVIDFNNKEEFENSLNEAVNSIGFNMDEPTVENTYYIGLAYLNGINVEVNRSIAYELIKEAAEKDLPDAMKKMVFMYREGMGVERDYVTAIEWQKRLCEYYSGIYESTLDDEIAIKLFNEYINLGDFQRELALYSDAAQAYGKTVSIAESYAAKHGGEKGNHLFCSAYNRLIILYSETGEYTKAENYLSKLLKIADELYNDSDILKLMYYSNAGIVYIGCQRYEKSAEVLNEALEMYSKHQKENANSIYMLAIIHENIASSYMNLSVMDKAQEHLNTAVATYEFLQKEFGVNCEERICSCMSSLAFAEKGLGNYDSADKAARKAYDRSFAAYQEYPKPSYIVFMAISSNALGLISQLRGDIKGAENCFKKAIELYEKTDTVSNKMNRYSLALVLNNLGTLYLESDLENAVLTLEKGCEIFTEICKDEPRFREMTALNCYNLSSAYYKAGNFKTALQYGLVAMELYSDLLNEGHMQFESLYTLTSKCVFYSYIASFKFIKAFKFQYRSSKFLADIKLRYE